MAIYINGYKIGSEASIHIGETTKVNKIKKGLDSDTVKGLIANTTFGSTECKAEKKEEE